MNLGERYKKLRQKIKDNNGNAISIKELSQSICIAAPRISELENNKREMSLTELKAYHTFFNVSFEYLLGETDIKSTKEDITSICKFTGLSEKTVEEIVSPSFFPRIDLSKIFNFLAEQYIEENILFKTEEESLKSHSNEEVDTQRKSILGLLWEYLFDNYVIPPVTFNDLSEKLKDVTLDELIESSSSNVVMYVVKSPEKYVRLINADDLKDIILSDLITELKCARKYITSKEREVSDNGNNNPTNK